MAITFTTRVDLEDLLVVAGADPLDRAVWISSQSALKSSRLAVGSQPFFSNTLLR
jgi:hypothetical protein